MEEVISHEFFKSIVSQVQIESSCVEGLIKLIFINNSKNIRFFLKKMGVFDCYSSNWKVKERALLTMYSAS